METMYTEALIELGKALTTLAVKGTASAINTKVKSIKDEKNVEKVRATYDEIINEILSERDEAVRIAQVYRDELSRIEISDSDIEHLNNTVGRVLEILKVMSPNMPLETYEQIRKLINVDTLKSMQLLGFNYKAAIGEPLTELCASAILSKGKNTNNIKQKK